jgi:NAD(P)-dependent dehydrogenase (short-subunit alcohol dehydrogenase family)
MARLALVTGGCRRLGAAISLTLAQAGYDLALHGHNNAEPEPWLATALSEGNAAWRGFVADFTQPDAATALFDKVVEYFGRPPDLLVNGASLFGQDQLCDVTSDDLQSHAAVGYIAPTLLIRAFAGAETNAAPGERSVVNLLDQRLVRPHRDQLAYTLSKFGLAGLTQVAAQTLAPHIRVNAVGPGLTVPTNDYDDEQMRRLAARMPLGRLALPAEVAAAVLFLDRAKTLNGQVIHVDGGAHLVSFERDFMHL